MQAPAGDGRRVLAYLREMADPIRRERRRARSREKMKLWRRAHPEEVRALNQTEAHKAWKRQWSKRYDKKPARKQYRSRFNTAWSKKRRATDPNYKILHCLRTRMGRIIRSKRPFKTKDLIGCSVAELRGHLESLFKPGMAWSNHGVKGWHIDHRRPLASFNFVNADGSINEEELRRAMHLTNLQPLWYWENMSKGAKLA